MDAQSKLYFSKQSSSSNKPITSMNQSTPKNPEKTVMNRQILVERCISTNDGVKMIDSNQMDESLLMPDSVPYVEKKSELHTFSESNSGTKERNSRRRSLRGLKLVQPYTNRGKKYTQSKCSSDSECEPEYKYKPLGASARSLSGGNNSDSRCKVDTASKHLSPGNERSNLNNAPIGRSHSDYGFSNMGFGKKFRKSKSDSSKSGNNSTSKNNSQNSQNTSQNNSQTPSKNHSRNPSQDDNTPATPLPTKVSRLKSNDSNQTNTSSIPDSNYLGIGACFSTPNNMSYSSNSSNNGGGIEFDRNLKRFNSTGYTNRTESRERSRHFSDNSGMSTHEKIVKTETKRGSILSRRMFSIGYKSKNSNFHKYFRNIPQTERLLEDYACALVKDILIQGRIYISQNWICFHANILSWETTLQIPVGKVREVKKASTIRVIPNAILLELADDGTPGYEEPVRFTSFLDRNSTYNVLNNLVRVHNSDKESIELNSVLWGLVLKRYHSANDLTEMLCEQGWEKKGRSTGGTSPAGRRPSGENSGLLRSKSNPRLDRTQSSDDGNFSTGSSNAQILDSVDQFQDALANHDNLESQSTTKTSTLKPTSSQKSRKSPQIINVDTSGVNQQPDYGLVVANETFPVSSEELFNLCFDETTEFRLEYNKQIKKNFLSHGEFKAIDENNLNVLQKFRVSKMDINNPVLKKVVTNNETLTVTRHQLHTDSKLIEVESVTNTPDVPYGTCFNVLIKSKFIPITVPEVEENSDETTLGKGYSTRVVSSVDVKFLRRPIGSSLVETPSRKGVQDHWSKQVKAISDYLSRERSKADSKTASNNASNENSGHSTNSGQSNNLTLVNKQLDPNNNITHSSSTKSNIHVAQVAQNINSNPSKNSQQNNTSILPNKNTLHQNSQISQNIGLETNYSSDTESSNSFTNKILITLTILLLLILVMLFRMGNRLTVLEQQMGEFKHDAASNIADSRININPIHDSNLHATNVPASEATCNADDGSCHDNNMYSNRQSESDDIRAIKIDLENILNKLNMNI